ncbi:MAG: hypothetical protein CVU56_13625 [Deltaproteobacteria bacterium HGW-Deltaproteobacteria-14]|jgi:carbamoyltransferase|nr:MAG: hypothetical protein CVU56_13625 [Deltaproteobacteria bacterium HGW-Deltaproteobacteria-14]
MTLILGVSALYHDSAAALVRDGEIIAAAQEERFTRVKHDARFPEAAIAWCLEAAGARPADLAAVAFYDKPLSKLDRILRTTAAIAPRGLGTFMRAMPSWLGDKLDVRAALDRALGARWRGPLYYPAHHESHAASAFFPSPFDEAAILTMDGVGEWATTSFGAGRGNRLTLDHELRFPDSIGLLYAAFTQYAGFRVNGGEYKLMGLAPYGEPRFADLIREHLVDLRADGSFRLDQRYFAYRAGRTMTSPRFHRLFGGPPRVPESEITQRTIDIAASIQRVTEDIVLRVTRHVRAVTGQRRLCLAGGVALNCVANGKVVRDGAFDEVWIQPAATDSGGALGAALLVWHQLLDHPRVPQRPDAQRGSLLGPSFDRAAVLATLDRARADYRVFDDEGALCAEVARRLAAGQVVGHFHGQMEFGPRALGNRSILADPRHPRMRELLNAKIKRREAFRPFAPAVLASRAHELFDLDRPSPYMLLTVPVAPARRVPLDPGEARLTGLDRRHARLSEIPAVTHVDHSARVQTVDAVVSPRFHRIIEAFDAQTGYPVVVNTSLNVRGEPIACTPDDAYSCFLFTDMDAIVLEDVLCAKDLAGATP